MSFLLSKYDIQTNSIYNGYECVNAKGSEPGYNMIEFYKDTYSMKDKIIFDVGHQSYVHKILTGRKDMFDRLRQMDGISGFPKISESEHDAANTGHSSTSISQALGMAKARDLKHEDSNIVAIIGDGALTGGIAYEALNHAGKANTNLIVILNDNEMSISKNVGSMPEYLNKIRTYLK